MRSLGRHVAQWSRHQALDTKQQIIDQFSAHHWLENVSLFLCYSSLICQKKKKKTKKGERERGKEGGREGRKKKNRKEAANIA